MKECCKLATYLPNYDAEVKFYYTADANCCTVTLMRLLSYGMV